MPNSLIYKGVVKSLTVSKMCLESFDDDDNIRGVVKNYEKRLLTFKNWTGVINPEDLAKAGFYFTQYMDVCRCVYCLIEIFQWKEGDCPIEEHYKNARYCDLAHILYKCKALNTEKKVSKKNNFVFCSVLFFLLLFVLQCLLSTTTTTR